MSAWQKTAKFPRGSKTQAEPRNLTPAKLPSQITQPNRLAHRQRQLAAVGDHVDAAG